MKFTSTLNVLVLTNFSRLLASPTNRDNYAKLTQSPLPSLPASGPLDYHHEGQEDSKSADNANVSCQKDLENHYQQGNSYPIPVSKRDNYSYNNRDNHSPNTKVDPYYIWSPRPHLGSYSFLDRSDDALFKYKASPYYVWSPRPILDSYSTNFNDEVYYRDEEPYSLYSQHANARYDYHNLKRPTRHSSGEHAKLHI